jgi:hypothetical protein
MTEQANDSDLVESLDDALVRLKRAIDVRLPLARGDRLEADRLFVFAGQVDAALRAASTHLQRVRSELESLARNPS